MNSDITTRLRQTRADMIGTDDEAHYWDCHEAAAEIERLRARPCPYVTGTVTRHCTLTTFTLTDAERHVLREVREIYANEDDVPCNEIAAVLDRLLERT